MSMSVRGNRPPGGCRARIYIILYASRPRAACPLPARGTNGRVWWNGAKGLSLHRQKEEERRLFLFSRFKGQTILYERKNYPI